MNSKPFQNWVPLACPDLKVTVERKKTWNFLLQLEVTKGFKATSRTGTYRCRDRKNGRCELHLRIRFKFPQRLTAVRSKECEDRVGCVEVWRIGIHVLFETLKKEPKDGQKAFETQGR